MWIKLFPKFRVRGTFYALYFNIIILEDENVTIFAAGKNLLNKILSLSITSDKKLLLSCRRKGGRNIHLLGQTRLRTNRY
jgi:hypothetical protein